MEELTALTATTTTVALSPSNLPNLATSARGNTIWTRPRRVESVPLSPSTRLLLCRSG